MMMRSLDEETKIYNNGDIILTSVGRIYLEKNMKESVELMTSIRNTMIKDFNLSIIKKEREFTLDTRIYLKDNLIVNSYLKISNLFMRYLIENKINVGYEALNMQDITTGIVKKIGYLEFKTLSDDDIHSLLKPVYYRYWYNRNKNLSGVLESIQDNYLPEKIVLYNVKCYIENSKLKLLDYFEIDLSETLYLEKIKKWKEYKCVSLGDIQEFDKVEILFNKNIFIINEIIFYVKK